jgi:3-dehydrosphinganine reductase
MALGLELAAKGTWQYFFLSGSSADLAGAHILLLARGQEGLEKAQKEMLAARQEATQTIVYQCVDLTKSAEVRIGLEFGDWDLS